MSMDRIRPVSHRLLFYYPFFDRLDQASKARPPPSFSGGASNVTYEGSAMTSLRRKLSARHSTMHHPRAAACMNGHWHILELASVTRGEEVGGGSSHGTALVQGVSACLCLRERVLVVHGLFLVFLARKTASPLWMRAGGWVMPCDLHSVWVGKPGIHPSCVVRDLLFGGGEGVGGQLPTTSSVSLSLSTSAPC